MEQTSDRRPVQISVLTVRWLRHLRFHEDDGLKAGFPWRNEASDLRPQCHVGSSDVTAVTRMDKLFDKFDVLVTASQSGGAELLRELEEAPKHPTTKTRHPNESRAPDGVSSLCGLPALTVPCGFSKEKLPYGLGFMARALQDENTLAAANLFQTHTDWHYQYPPIAV